MLEAFASLSLDSVNPGDLSTGHARHLPISASLVSQYLAEDLASTTEKNWLQQTHRQRAFAHS